MSGEAAEDEDEDAPSVAYHRRPGPKRSEAPLPAPRQATDTPLTPLITTKKKTVKHKYTTMYECRNCSDKRTLEE